MRFSLITYIGCMFVSLSAFGTTADVCSGHPAPDNDSVPAALFGLPFDFVPVFSGNFGELRANHFHGGLDFKTQGASGKPMRALADGYLKRIRVTHGSGYVLDVAYDNGYYTICRHLSAFVGDVARMVEQKQYETESWEVDITPEPGEFPVRTDQVIALSGNTGYSFGPHLHLDLIETATDDYVDPLPFFATRVKDRTAPRAEGLMLFAKPGEGVIDGAAEPRRYPVSPRQPIRAWGWIGAAIRAYDYMDGVRNRYGVKSVVLTVDGREVFRSEVDRFAYAENRYINSWTYGQYMKSFVDPGNRLRMLRADASRGWVEIAEARPYRFEYTLTDALGNRSRVAFTVEGTPQALPAVEPCRDRYHFRWNRVNQLQEPGLSLVVPRGMLYADVALRYAARADSADVAHTYRLHDTAVPLHGYCELTIGLRRRPEVDASKLYVAAIDKRGRKHRVGGTYHPDAGAAYPYGAMHARIRELTTYTVAIDTVPPVLTPLAKEAWGRNGKIRFKAADRQTGIHSYRGTIDGRYALFGKPNAINGILECRLDEHRVERGVRHELVMEVVDACGNRTVEVYPFVW